MKQQADRILPDCVLWDPECRFDSPVSHHWGHKHSCHFFVLCRLDYYKSPLAGSPPKLVNRVQRVMNCAARLVCNAPRREHDTPTTLPILVDLRWLPVECRIEYKIVAIHYVVITYTAAPYCSNLLELYIPSHAISSSADNHHILLFETGARNCIGPFVWNNLP